MNGKPWTDTELDTLRKIFPDINTQAVATVLGRSYSAVSGKAVQLGLKKSAAFYKSEASGRLNKGNPATQFKKGNNPWNAGRTGIRISPKSEFKKGRKPHNTAYDGCVRIRNDRDSKTGIIRPYKYIRLKERVWVLYQRFVWEQLHGPIPRGHVIRFIDGDQMNCHPDNLEMISTSENALRNHNRDKFKKTIALMVEEGDMPSANLTDTYIVGIMARGDQQMKNILSLHPEIIEAKRTQLLLKRKLKDNEKQTK